MARKLTYKEVKDYVEGENGNGCKLLSEEYINSTTKMKILCKCNREFLVHWDHFKNRNKRQCNQCGLNALSNRFKFSDEQVRFFIENESKSGCKWVEGEYKNNRSKLKIMCKCGNIYVTDSDTFKGKKKFTCKECSNKRISEAKKLKHIDVKKFIKNNSNCELLSEKYLGSQELMLIQCGCGKVFKTSFNTFKYSRKRHCDECGMENMKKALRLQYDDVRLFIENNSSCKLLSNKYLNDSSKLELLCECGTKFFTTYDSFKRNGKRVCDKCARANPHNKYTYEYVKNFIEIESESGCKLESKKYISGAKRLKIRCSCGDIFYTPFTIFRNYGKRKCDKCTNVMSKGERRIYEYLDDKGVKFLMEYVIDGLNGVSGKPLRFDFALYDSNNKFKFCCEFDGEFHYVEGYERTRDYGALERQQIHDQLKNDYCKQNNIPLLRIPYWEFDNIESILEKELSKYNLN